MPRVIRNPMAHRLPDDPAWRPSPAALAFHRRLPGYRPTPLVSAPRLAERLGIARVLVKDESNRFGLPAFKMLGASWAAYRALVDRLGAEPSWRTVDQLATAFVALRPLELVTATDGNHGRAVAHVARLFGLAARVFVAQGTAVARTAAIAGEGAAVEEVPGDYDAAVASSAAYAAAGGPRALLVSDTSWDGYEDVPRRVIEGYATIFAEIDEQAGPPPDLVVVPVGVGALAAAAVLHYRAGRGGPPPLLAAVEPEGADCLLRSVLAGRRTTVAGPHPSMMVGLNCGTPSLVAWPIVSAGIDWCLTVDDGRAAAAMRWLAEEGIVSGETGASATAGLAALLASGEAEVSTALVLSTEGATDASHYRSLVGQAPEAVGRVGSH